MDNKNLGVYSEADRAKIILVHTPGEELFFGSISPKSALYEGPLNKDKAIEEHKNYVNMLKENGIKVIQIRDVLKNIDREKIEKLAHESLIYEGTVNDELLEEKRKVVESSSLDGLVDIILLRPRVNIRPSDEKNTDYKSVIMPEPLYNMMFMRDQQITTEKGIVIGKMNSSQRSLEVEISNMVFKELGMDIVYEVKGEGRLEGGDYLPIGDKALLGVGLRTNAEAAKQLLKNDVFGKEEVALVIDMWKKQDEMHLDTYLNFPSYDKAVILDERLGINSPEVVVYRKEGNLYVRKEITKLDKYLKDNGFEIIPVSKKEQLAYAINFLTLENNKVIGVSSVPEEYKNRLEKKGIEFIEVNLDNITKAYGGPHCLTQVVYRESPENILTPIAKDFYNINEFNMD